MDADVWCVDDFTNVWDELHFVESDPASIIWDAMDEDVWRFCRVPAPYFGWFTKYDAWEIVCWWVGLEGIIDEVDSEGDWDGNNVITSEHDHLFKWRYIFASDGDI